MFHLLKVRVSGFKMLEDDFEIDFVAKARVYNSDEESEIIEIDKNLYTFNMFAFTGSNSSGKTSTLLLLNRIITLMGTGRWQYVPIEFSRDTINMHIEFYLDGQIYIYDSKILKNSDPGLNISSQFCRIIDEVVKYSTYNPIVGKRYEE